MRRTVAVLVSALVTTAASVLIAAPAQALPQCNWGYRCNLTFYSNPARTIQVGARTTFCDGTQSNWGTVTTHTRYTTSPCPGPND